MWVGTFSGVTSAGIVISSAFGGTCVLSEQNRWIGSGQSGGTCDLSVGSLGWHLCFNPNPPKYVAIVRDFGHGILPRVYVRQHPKALVIVYEKKIGNLPKQ